MRHITLDCKYLMHESDVPTIGLIAIKLAISAKRLCVLRINEHIVSQ